MVGRMWHDVGTADASTDGRVGLLPGERELTVDVAVGALLAAVWFAGLEVGVDRGWHPTDPESWRLAGVCLGVAYAARRAGGVWLAAGLALLYPLVYFRPLVSYFHLLPVLVLGFAGARERRHLWAVVVACTAAVLVLFSPLVEQNHAIVRPWRTDWSGLALAGCATWSVIALGAAMASQRRAVADLADRNRQLERLRQVEADRAVADERLRISREVHDVVAHHLTAILMRAQAADRVRASRPEEARLAVSWIAEESREALRATRETIHSLRARTPPPYPSTSAGTLLSDLGEMVERVGEVGLDARLDIRWRAEPALAPAVATTVRRVVQEALTNVLKHAAASEAVVTLQPADGGLGVQVSDDGIGGRGALTGASDGAGLIGMQERLAACGGRLRYGPGPSGGWRIQMWVPVEGGRAG